jgi:hypothetical protein
MRIKSEMIDSGGYTGIIADVVVIDWIPYPV